MRADRVDPLCKQRRLVQQLLNDLSYPSAPRQTPTVILERGVEDEFVRNASREFCDVLHAQHAFQQLDDHAQVAKWFVTNNRGRTDSRNGRILRRKKDFRVHLVEQREGRGLDDGIITNVHNRKVCRKTEESEEAVNASVADVVVSQRHELNGAVKT